MSRIIKTKEDKRLVKFMARLISEYSKEDNIEPGLMQRNMKIHTAHKDYECDLCGKKIPKGDKYWREHDESEDNSELYGAKEHTNCELY